MNTNELKEIYKRVKSRNFTINHVCEVGVYLPETSNIINFIKDGCLATLVEPSPQNVEAIKNIFGKYNITIHPVAIYDYNGTLKLVNYQASTFVADLKNSPALENETAKVKDLSTIEVECKKFSEVDDGTIDLLSVDTEGSEWYVLKYLKSSPKIISIETHGKAYQNPFLIEILNWAKLNNYEIWYKDSTDTVFIKRGIIEITFQEKIQLFLKSLIIYWQKKKYRFKKVLFST